MNTDDYINGWFDDVEGLPHINEIMQHKSAEYLRGYSSRREWDKLKLELKERQDGHKFSIPQ